MAIRCPKCLGMDIRRSQTTTLMSWILGILRLYPMRCRYCRHRFYRRQQNEPGE